MARLNRYFSVSVSGGSETEREKTEEEAVLSSISLRLLLLQGIATSIDALSVGFTIAGYSMLRATGAALIIGITTFLLCMIALTLGKRLGDILSSFAAPAGGMILIIIGIKMLLG